MTPFYSTPERIAALDAQVRLWMGTPFRAGSAVAGPLGGVDCVGLQAAIHTATGATQAIELPRKPLDWHLHHDNSAILDFFHAPEIRQKLQRIESYDAYLHGDLMAVRTGLCEHHLGTWLNDSRGQHLLHIPINGTVQRWSIGAVPLAGKIAVVWRIIEQ